jgi:hypothetical protein
MTTSWSSPRIRWRALRVWSRGARSHCAVGMPSPACRAQDLAGRGADPPVVKVSLKYVPECLVKQGDTAIHGCVEGVPLSTLCPNDTAGRPASAGSGSLLAEMTEAPSQRLPESLRSWPSDGSSRAFLRNARRTDGGTGPDAELACFRRTVRRPRRTGRRHVGLSGTRICTVTTSSSPLQVSVVQRASELACTPLRGITAAAEISSALYRWHSALLAVPPKSSSR